MSVFCFTVAGSARINTVQEHPGHAVSSGAMIHSDTITKTVQTGYQFYERQVVLSACTNAVPLLLLKVQAAMSVLF